MRRHSLAHGRHQLGNAFRVLQHGGATAVAVHGFGRAAKVQVNAFGVQPRQIGGIGSHVIRVRAQQLGAHRHACQGFAAVEQLGHITQKDAIRQDGAADADEL